MQLAVRFIVGCILMSTTTSNIIFLEHTHRCALCPLKSISNVQKRSSSNSTKAVFSG